MLQVEMIGNLGADAEVKNSNGKEFVVMRLAHADKWTDAAGQEHDSTTWVDVILNGDRSKLLPYLKQGVKVFVRGDAKLRVYSSQKDRCMKAGLQINAWEIELCGGNNDAVPRQLIDPDTAAIYEVAKYYQSNFDTSKWKKEDSKLLVDKNGSQYTVVKGGWVAPNSIQDESTTDSSEGNG